MSDIRGVRTLTHRRQSAACLWFSKRFAKGGVSTRQTDRHRHPARESYGPHGPKPITPLHKEKRMTTNYVTRDNFGMYADANSCLLYTSDAADE